MMSGKDFLRSHVLIWRGKVYSGWKDVASSGKTFQVFGPTIGKARLPTVDRLTGGTRARSSVQRHPRKLQQKAVAAIVAATIAATISLCRCDSRSIRLHVHELRRRRVARETLRLAPLSVVINLWGRRKKCTTTIAADE